MYVEDWKDEQDNCTLNVCSDDGVIFCSVVQRPRQDGIFWESDREHCEARAGTIVAALHDAYHDYVTS